MEPVSEDLGLLLVEQFREQMNNLAAAVQLLTPVVQEKGGCQYEPYLAILHYIVKYLLLYFLLFCFKWYDCFLLNE